MDAPLIGISTTTGPTGEYANAISRSGGTPRILSFDTGSLEAQLAGVRGIVLSGGGDVVPSRYGVTSDAAHDLNDTRDGFEIALVLHARATALPTLCICRGMQVANVAFGGTLVPDIADAYGDAVGRQHRRLDARGKSERGLIPGHIVALDAGSRVRDIVGSGELPTGSRHHQALGRIAEGLRVVGRTADGIVEAVEATFDSPFFVGVQWHPESTLAAADGGASIALFMRFIESASAVRV